MSGYSPSARGKKCRPRKIRTSISVMTRGKGAELTERSPDAAIVECAQKLTTVGKRIEKEALSLSAPKGASPKGDEALTQIARQRA